MNTHRFSLIIEKDQAGYFAYCPELQGCYSQGENYEETLESIRDAVRLYVEDMRESGEEISQPEFISMTWLELAV